MKGTLVLAVAAALVAATPAWALDRKHADAIALRALKPPKGASVFRLPAALPAGTVAKFDVIAAPKISR